MPKRRYSNFHRARKYYRKFIGTFPSVGHGGSLDGHFYFFDQYEKYARRAEERDSIIISHTKHERGDAFSKLLFIDTKSTLRSKFTQDLISMYNREVSDDPQTTRSH